MWHLRNSPGGSRNPQDGEAAVWKAVETWRQQAVTSKDIWDSQ